MFAVVPFLLSLVIGGVLVGAILAARHRGKLSRPTAVVLALFIVLLVVAATWLAPVPYIV
jgi:hypothetical protein